MLERGVVQALFLQFLGDSVVLSVGFASRLRLTYAGCQQNQSQTGLAAAAFMSESLRERMQQAEKGAGPTLAKTISHRSERVKEVRTPPFASARFPSKSRADSCGRHLWPCHFRGVFFPEGPNLFRGHGGGFLLVLPGRPGKE